MKKILLFLPLLVAGGTDDWENHAVRDLNAPKQNLRTQDGNPVAGLIDQWQFTGTGHYLSVMLIGAMGVDDVGKLVWEIEPGSEKWSNVDYHFISSTKPDPNAVPIEEIEFRPYRGEPIPDRYGLILGPDGTCEYRITHFRLRPADGVDMGTFRSLGRWEVEDDLLVLYFKVEPRMSVSFSIQDVTVDEEPTHKIVLRYAIEGNRLTLTTQGYEELE